MSTVAGRGGGRRRDYAKTPFTKLLSGSLDEVCRKSTLGVRYVQPVTIKDAIIKASRNLERVSQPVPG